MNRKFRNIALSAICSSFLINVPANAIEIPAYALAINKVSEIFGARKDYKHYFKVQLRDHFGEIQDVIPDDTNKGMIALKNISEDIICKIEVEKDGNFDGRIECPICLDKIKYTDSILVTDCKHCYHKDCIGKWLESKSSCPLCREDILDKSAFLLVSREEVKNARKYSGFAHPQIQDHINDNQFGFNMNQPLGFNMNINIPQHNPPVNRRRDILDQSNLTRPKYTSPSYSYFLKIPDILEYLRTMELPDMLPAIAHHCIRNGLILPQIRAARDISSNYLKSLPNGNHALCNSCSVCGGLTNTDTWGGVPNPVYIITSCHHAVHPLCLKNFLLASDRNIGDNTTLRCPVCNQTLAKKAYLVLSPRAVWFFQDFLGLAKKGVPAP